MTDKDFYMNGEKAKKLAVDALEMAQAAIKHSSADETEVVVSASDSALTRFANSQIHQNNFERNANITVRAAIGKRVAKASGNILTKDGLQTVADDACALAKVAAEDDNWAGLPEGDFKYPIKVNFYENTARVTPADRAAVLKEVFDIAGSAYEAAGTLSNTVITLAIANSHGVKTFCNTTASQVTVLYTGADSSGYGENFQRDFSKLTISESARHAFAKAEASRNPSNEVGVGKYTVILEEEAIAQLLMYLSWLGFSGKSYQDNESFLVGKLGTQITGGNITLYDDASDPRTMGLPFDYEGVPKSKLMLIENGVAKGYAHCWKTAKKDGVRSTGHYLGFEEPLPVNMVLAPGDKTKDELIASTDYGILVSRFHYSNVVNPMETVITGMTRDGTFLIENGKISKGLKNFRYTQNVLAAFGNNDGLTSAQAFSSAFFGGGAVVPAMKIKDFNFSGKTDF